MFKDGEIEGVVVKDLLYHADRRGWLAEMFREDELPDDVRPAMSYISMTNPGMARGPHSHREQTDVFVFFTSTFRLTLWDGREGSPTRGNRMVLEAGEERPLCVVIPPGVVHAYKNVGGREGLVINLPNRLYAGWGKREPVDEVRFEDDPASPYVVD